MNNLLYFLIVVLLIFWAIGYFVWLANGLIHLLLLLVIIAIILRIMRRNRRNGGSSNP